MGDERKPEPLAALGLAGLLLDALREADASDAPGILQEMKPLLELLPEEHAAAVHAEVEKAELRISKGK